MEEHETISGEDAKRVLRGEEMKDCYNVTTIQRSEDDDMDKEIYEARYKKEVVEEKVEEPTKLKKDDAITMVAKKMLDLRLDEEKQVFEQLLKNDLEHPKAEEQPPKEEKE